MGHSYKGGTVTKTVAPSPPPPAPHMEWDGTIFHVTGYLPPQIVYAYAYDADTDSYQQYYAAPAMVDTLIPPSEFDGPYFCDPSGLLTAPGPNSTNLASTAG